MSVKPVGTASALVMGLGALLAGAAFTGTTGASAADAAVQQAQPKAQEGERSRRICRTITPSGSRLTRRVCRTQAEWDENEHRTQEGVLRHQMGPGSTYEQDPGPFIGVPGPRQS